MAEAATPNRRPTNRRVYESEAKRPTITFRVRDELHAKLKASAEARGYSLSEEIEHRLNVSMDTASDHFAEMALKLISDNWRAIQSISRRKMVEDKFTLQACCEAAYRATELLAGVNGMDLHVGLLDGLGPEGNNIEAAKQLGHAIVYHRELLHMKSPPPEAVAVYEGSVIDALVKRMAYLQARVDGTAAQGAPTPASTAAEIEVPQAPTRAREPAPLPEGTRWITDQEIAGMIAVDDPQRPASLFDAHDFADLNMEMVGGPDDGEDPPAPPPAPTPAPARRKARAKA